MYRLMLEGDADGIKAIRFTKAFYDASHLMVGLSRNCNPWHLTFEDNYTNQTRYTVLVLFGLTLCFRKFCVKGWLDRYKLGLNPEMEQGNFSSFSAQTAGYSMRKLCEEGKVHFPACHFYDGWDRLNSNFFKTDRKRETTDSLKRKRKEAEAHQFASVEDMEALSAVYLAESEAAAKKQKTSGGFSSSSSSSSSSAK